MGTMESAALVSGSVNYLLIDGQTKCLKSLQQTDLVTIEVGNVTNQLQDFLGGAAAYIWRQTFSNSFLDWLFSEERLRRDSLNIKRGKSKNERDVVELSEGSDRSRGLNILTG